MVKKTLEETVNQFIEYIDKKEFDMKKKINYIDALTQIINNSDLSSEITERLINDLILPRNRYFIYENNLYAFADKYGYSSHTPSAAWRYFKTTETFWYEQEIYERRNDSIDGFTSLLKNIRGIGREKLKKSHWSKNYLIGTLSKKIYNFLGAYFSFCKYNNIETNKQIPNLDEPINYDPMRVFLLMHQCDGNVITDIIGTMKYKHDFISYKDLADSMTNIKKSRLSNHRNGVLNILLHQSLGKFEKYAGLVNIYFTDNVFKDAY